MPTTQSSFPVPINECARVAALTEYDLLDTPPETDYDKITRFVAQLMHVPICLMSIVGDDYQWLKSRWGLEVESTPRSVAFCAYTIMQEEVLVVPDALLDARFRDNPLVTGEPHIRFYAGVPLIGHDGVQLGALCLIDRVPRKLCDAGRSALIEMGGIVAELMKHRRAHILLLRAEQAAHEATEQTRRTLDAKTRRLEFVRSELFGVVTDIASLARHSNTLALNAKIEAARAGLAGTAFSAVATEMNRLAVDTRSATSRAEALLGLESRAEAIA